MCRWQQYCDARISLETTHGLEARERVRHIADRVELEYARLDALTKLFARELAEAEARVKMARDFESLAALRRGAVSSVRE